MKNIIICVLTLIGVVALYWIGTIYMIPSWTNRGLFGDMFGALNAVFSGVALIGVVYALYLQQDQTRHMQDALKLQYQPLLQLNFTKAYVEKPKVFTMPSVDGCCALSRYHFDFKIINISDAPATDIIVSSQLCSDANAFKEELRTADSHFRVAAKQNDNEDSLFFAPDPPFTTFLQAIRDEDVAKIPTLMVATVYKNLMGAIFLVSESYHIIKKHDDETLGNWESSISSFSAKYKKEMRELETFKTERSKWSTLFDDLKEKYSSTIDGPEEVELEVIPIPGAYSTRLLTESDYRDFLKRVGFGRLTFPHTQCLASKDE